MDRITPSQRLHQIMSERNLKQIDILRMSEPYQKELGIKMSKSHLSQYVNGKSNPDQNKLYLLGKTLGVNEAWLMGFDVPKDRTADKKIQQTHNNITTIYNQLQEPRQQKVYRFAEQQLEEQNNTVLEEAVPYTVVINGLMTAGHGSENFDKDNALEMVTVDSVPAHYDLAFRVSGDSMYPTFEDGEIIFVKKVDEVNNGMIGCIEINKEAFIKKIYVENDRLRLVSLNNDKDDNGNRLYPDFYADEADEVYIVGKVIL